MLFWSELENEYLRNCYLEEDHAKLVHHANCMHSIFDIALILDLKIAISEMMVLAWLNDINHNTKCQQCTLK